VMPRHVADAADICRTMGKHQRIKQILRFPDPFHPTGPLHPPHPGTVTAVCLCSAVMAWYVAPTPPLPLSSSFLVHVARLPMQRCDACLQTFAVVYHGQKVPFFEKPPLSPPLSLSDSPATPPHVSPCVSVASPCMPGVQLSQWIPRLHSFRTSIRILPRRRDVL
jgi:hypothetical protein